MPLMIGGSGTVVAHRQQQVPVFFLRNNLDRDRFARGGNPVFDGILDQGLKDHARNLEARQFGGEIDARLQSLGKADRFDFQIMFLLDI